MIIRNENEKDYREVEELTKLAFWNLHTPGCDEHYLVHTLRTHKDFIPKLDLVITDKDKIIGNIMYTKSKLRNITTNETKDILTFGPLSIHPDYQRKGYGKMLISKSIEIAKELGYSYIVIFGNPGNYVNSGFISCIKYKICVGNNIYPTAMLVNKIGKDTLKNDVWEFIESDVYNLDEKEVSDFDNDFEPMEKLINDKQEEFFILSNSRIIIE